MSIEPPPLSYKKWRLIGNQTAVSSHISPGVLTSNPFDQMRTASILGGFAAEIRGSAPAMSCFVAAGSSPYTGFYYAIEVRYVGPTAFLRQRELLLVGLFDSIKSFWMPVARM